MPAHWQLQIWLTLLMTYGPGIACAGQDSDNSLAGGLSVSQDLRHRVVIPQIIYFRIGSDTFGDVDKVRFDVNPGAGPGCIFRPEPLARLFASGQSDT